MRAIFVLLAVEIFAALGTGCGRTNESTHSSSIGTSPVAVGSSHAATSDGYMKYDGDTDTDDHGLRGPSNDDQWEMVSAQSHGAAPADKQAATIAVRNYYAAAANDDGAKGCQMLTTRLASAISTSGAKTCASSLARLFEQQHTHIATENPATMIVTGVHVADDVAFVTLGFRTSQEGEMLLQREGRAWKINALFDSPLP